MDAKEKTDKQLTTERNCCECGAENAKYRVHPYKMLGLRDFQNDWYCDACYNKEYERMRSPYTKLDKYLLNR